MQLQHAVLLAMAAASATAQYINDNTIGSCADVDCPLQGDGVGPSNCQITNRTHLHIGLREFSSAITEDNTGLTWTVGVQVYDGPEPDTSLGDVRRKIDKVFYLGTPPSLDLGRDDLPYDGCAIFFYGNKQYASERVNSWTCEDVIGTSCYNNLQDNARSLFQRLSAENVNLTSEEICQQTKEGLNATFPEGCNRLAGQDFWNQSQAVCKSSCPLCYS